MDIEHSRKERRFPGSSSSWKTGLSQCSSPEDSSAFFLVEIAHRVLVPSLLSVTQPSTIITCFCNTQTVLFSNRQEDRSLLTQKIEKCSCSQILRRWSRNKRETFIEWNAISEQWTLNKWCSILLNSEWFQREYPGTSWNQKMLDTGLKAGDKNAREEACWNRLIPGMERSGMELRGG